MENKMKKLRKQKGLSQMEVAVRAGISLQGYRLIEAGVTRNPTPAIITRIKEIIGWTGK